MINIYTTVISLLISVGVLIGGFNLPAQWFDVVPDKLGAISLTDITSTDRLSNYTTTQNANNTILETAINGLQATTTMTLLTSAPNLATIGTIGTGIWQGTTIDELYGGTGLTSYSTGDILYASGANTLTTLSASSTDEVLTLSGGVPIWKAISTDQAANFNWTGLHDFAATTTMATTTITHLGVATTTPSTSFDFNVGGDVYITGGLGVGVGTTTAGNIETSGDILVGGTLYGLDIVSTSSTKTDCGTTSNDTCTQTVTCPTGYNEVLGGGGASGNSVGFLYESYRSASTTWTVSKRQYAAGGDANLTAYAICIK